MKRTTPNAPAAVRQPVLPLRRGPIVRPRRAALCGPGAVGKATPASQLRDPVFLDTEGGTHHLDVVRIEGSDSREAITAAIAAWAAVRARVQKNQSSRK